MMQMYRHGEPTTKLRILRLLRHGTLTTKIADKAVSVNRDAVRRAFRGLEADGLAAVAKADCVNGGMEYTYAITDRGRLMVRLAAELPPDTPGPMHGDGRLTVAGDILDSVIRQSMTRRELAVDTGRPFATIKTVVQHCARVGLLERDGRTLRITTHGRELLKAYGWDTRHITPERVG